MLWANTRITFLFFLRLAAILEIKLRFFQHGFPIRLYIRRLARTFLTIPGYRIVLLEKDCFATEISFMKLAVESLSK